MINTNNNFNKDGLMAWDNSFVNPYPMECNHTWDSTSKYNPRRLVISQNKGLWLFHMSNLEIARNHWIQQWKLWHLQTPIHIQLEILRVVIIKIKCLALSHSLSQKIQTLMIMPLGVLYIYTYILLNQTLVRHAEGSEEQWSGSDPTWWY